MHGLRLVYSTCHSRKPPAAHVHEVAQGILVHGTQLYARVHHRLPAEVGVRPTLGTTIARRRSLPIRFLLWQSLTCCLSYLPSH